MCFRKVGFQYLNTSWKPVMFKEIPINEHQKSKHILTIEGFHAKCVYKKLIFPRPTSGDLLLSEKQVAKQKKPFVLLTDEVTEAWHLVLVVRTDTSVIIHKIMLISYCCFISTKE